MVHSRTLVRKLMPLAVLGVLAFLLLFSSGPPAHAATITVNSTEDELNADGDCALREAIQAANTDVAVDTCPAGSGADTITLPAGTYTLSIPGADEDANATGDLDITADLTINGAGAAATIIDGATLDRVLHVVGATVEISGATIQNGSADPGGGMYNDQGSATLTNVTFSGNSHWGNGGGMYNVQGSATLTNVTFYGNSAGGAAGMGNVYSSATLTNVTFSGNSAGSSGGGMYNLYSSPTLTNVTFSGNAAGTYVGGGMYNVYSSPTLTDVTFSGNSASQYGGGMYNIYSSPTLTGVTFSTNHSHTHCGGMRNDSSSPTLTNVTFSGNFAQLGSGGGMCGWGGTLQSTIVANNSPNDCFGSITSAGHNLDSDNTCSLTAPGDLPGVDPLLGPLAENGGPTQTHALLAGSPAIGAGSSDCPPPITDQRGVARPQGAACDIGAYEAPAPVGGIAELPDIGQSSPGEAGVPSQGSG